MVAYTRDEIISATDLARNVSGTLSSLINQEKEKIAIMKNNKIEAVMISIDEYERFREVYEFIEMKLEENKIKYAEEVLKYTYPVFIKKLEEPKPELIGTSIIVSLDSRFYLLSASHVMKDVVNVNSSFYIGTKNKIVSRTCELCYSESKDDKNKDGFDIGFIELDKIFIENNNIMAFNLSEENIAKNDTQKYFGMLCGYPVSASMNHSKKAWRKDSQNYRGKPYWYTNIILKEKEAGSIVMNYGKNDKNEMPKKLRGMSGCGMWACHIATKKLQLAGIFIEHHKKRRGKADTLHATPIREVVEFIRMHNS